MRFPPAPHESFFRYVADDVYGAIDYDDRRAQSLTPLEVINLIAFALERWEVLKAKEAAERARDEAALKKAVHGDPYYYDG